MANNKKKWFRPVFNDDDSDSTMSETVVPKKIRLSTQNTSSSNKVTSQQSTSTLPYVANIHSSNWIETFAPKRIEDLAIHPKKMEEIQMWFSTAQTNRQKCAASILLITGPSGAGKTAAIRALAKELQYTINEWITPVDVELSRGAELANRWAGEDENVYTENQIDKFSQFLFRSSRYGSVFDGGSNSKKIVLVEDFPNIFLKHADGFVDIIERYKIYGKSPLVFIVTDTKSKKLDICQNLFSDAMREKFEIMKICFNASSTTLLKKALKRICAIMSSPPLSDHYKQPTGEQIDSIILTSQGDIRNAVINLHFTSQKNSVSLSMENLPQSSTTNNSAKGSRRKDAQQKFKSIGCDATITLMHALGRILNPKYTERCPKRLIHSPEVISDDFSSQPSTVVNLVHTNYLCHFQTIENVLFAADILSTSDLYSNEWRDDNLKLLSLNLAVRGVMSTNEQPSTGWFPIKGSRKIDSKGVDLSKLDGNNSLSKRILVSDVKTYADIISNKGYSNRSQVM